MKTARCAQTDSELLAELEQHSRSIVGSMAISGYVVSEETLRRAVQHAFENIKSGKLERRIQEARARFSKASASCGGDSVGP